MFFSPSVSNGGHGWGSERAYFKRHVHGIWKRVYLAGACNVGKSILASFVLGVEIPQSLKSTDGLKIYFGRNGTDLKDTTMVPLRENNTT